MTGFVFCVETDLSKEETIKRLDAAIEKARAEMETSIVEHGRTAEETVRLSQKLDPLVAHKQRMLLYGY